MITGNGTINADVTTVGGGQILPGDQTLPEDIQTLSVTGSLTMDQNSVAFFELAADTKQADLLSVSGNAHLASAELLVELLGDPNNLSPTDVFTIVSSNGTIDGTFNTLNADPTLVDAVDADGNVLATFVVNYNGNSVTLTEVPEPAISFLVLVGAVFCRRKKICNRACNQLSALLY